MMLENEPEHPPLPELGEAISNALDEAADLSDWIADHHPRQIYQNVCSMVAAPCYGIALEHREAILLLIRHNCRTSAYALVRSVYEATMQGKWAEKYLVEDVKVQEFIQKKAHFPKLDKLVQQLDAGTGAKTYTTFKSNAYEALSDFSHGGPLQLTRWTTQDELGSNHPDGEVVELLQWVNLFGLMAVWGIARLAGTATAEHEEKLSAYSSTMKGAVPT